MVSHDMALLVLLLHKGRIGRRPGADHKEGGFHAIAVEKSEDLRGIGGIGAIIKGQSDFWEMRIATIQRIAQHAWRRGRRWRWRRGR